ncbi:hypothetical protein ACFTSF_11035 [Kribbella sp. NPDC056951]|uniref:hypothetical protein n=1 Tax=Kribbella sp. NPDC056951 TaxID=3345978 RepID=UPI00363D5114
MLRRPPALPRDPAAHRNGLTTDATRSGRGRLHPFSQAYTEALNVGADAYTDAPYYSPVLDAWGRDLYDGVDPRLRAAVLHLATAAASSRPKEDVFFRLADWLGRVEPVVWYSETGFLQAAWMLRDRPVIEDSGSFLRGWPTGAYSREWRDQLDHLVDEDAGRDAAREDAEPAVEALVESGLFALDRAAFIWRRESMRNVIDSLSRVHGAGPDRGDMWDLEELLNEPLQAAVRSVARTTARTLCAQFGVALHSPAPDAHPVYEVGVGVCNAAVMAAVMPLVHAAHLRELDAFRLIATGQPFPEPPIWLRPIEDSA